MSVGNKTTLNIWTSTLITKARARDLVLQGTLMLMLSSGVSAQDLNAVVDRTSTLVGNLVTLVIGVAGLAGIIIATVGISKAFGFMEMKPGESKGGQTLKIIGGGALAGIAVLLELATRQVVGT